MTALTLAFLDLETTGLDPERHDILEIGVIRVDAATLEEIARTEVRVRPERLEDAWPKALRINGYSEAGWRHAASLREALCWISPYLSGACLAGHHVAFDRAFLDAAWKRVGIIPPPMDHHSLDTMVLSWPLLAAGVVDSLSLDAVSAYLGLDRSEPHRALADAESSLQVARHLLPPMELAAQLGRYRRDDRNRTTRRGRTLGGPACCVLCCSRDAGREVA